MKSLLFSLLAMCLLNPIAFAGGKKKPTPKPTPPGRIIIRIISSSGVTVETGLGTKSYQINDSTLFTYLGKRVSVADLKPGMRVTVTPTFDGITAALVAASDAPRVDAK